MHILSISPPVVSVCAVDFVLLSLKFYWMIVERLLWTTQHTNKSHLALMQQRSQTCLACVVVATDEQKGSKMDCNPVTASFAMTNTVTSDATIGGVTSDSPKDSEETGLHESLHSPTTGQMKSVSARV